MILLDTGIVIQYLRTSDARLLSLFQQHNAAICGVTRAEVLHGVRSSADQARFIAALDAFQLVPLPEGIWDDIGKNLASLRAAGQPMPFADVIIATLAVYLNTELWSRDQHHVAIQSVVPALRLFQEPP